MEQTKKTSQTNGVENILVLTPEPERTTSPQRSTRVIANKIIDYFGDAFDRDVARLTAKERIEIYIKLAPFAMPKLQASAVDITPNEALSDTKNQLIDLAKKFDKPKTNKQPQTAMSN